MKTTTQRADHVQRMTPKQLTHEIANQRKWIAEHGATRDGYLARYGSKAHPDFARWPVDGYYGDGGEAIFEADSNALAELEAALATVAFRNPVEAMDAGRRWCYAVPFGAYSDENGVVPSLVVEGVPGHFPMLGNGTGSSPWYWGQSVEEAQIVATKTNARRGITPEIAQLILDRSIAATMRRQPLTVAEMNELVPEPENAR